MKKALITGITGQDGSYLAEYLLNKNYQVHGLLRRSSVFTTERIEHLSNHKSTTKNRLFTYWGDLTDSSNLNRLIDKIQPDEIYNLAAQSHVKVSFDVPEYTADVDGIGCLRILDCIRNNANSIKFYQASTSELFGKVFETPQNENTPFYPRSPYAAAKIFAYWITVNYREAYDIFGCNGILFNHESERRDPRFVTRKITIGIAKIIKGLINRIELGNLNAKRDWGYAPDFVESMWLMLQNEKPDDYVIATGETRTVRDFCEIAFKTAGVDVVWEGKDIHERGIDKSNGKVLISVNPEHFRPTEVDILLGDASKAEKMLNWKPITTFEEMVEKMVDNDLSKNWEQ